MPLPDPVAGIGNFVAQQLNVQVWDGEVPRYDPSGNPINPFAQVTPSSWPVIKLYMMEQGFGRTWTTEDPYDDLGDILVQIWGTGRQQVKSVQDGIHDLLAQASNWGQINIGAQDTSPNGKFYIIQLLLKTHYLGQMEGMRTQASELIYRGDLYYDCHMHGIVSTL